MLKEFCKNQLQYINYFFENIDIQKLEEIITVIADCKGAVFFSGVGKSGFVAKKIATTLASTGIKSLYLSPTNALHGDIGIVGKNDVFVMLSKSGETDELVNLIPYLQNRGVTTISLVCNLNSRLSDASTHAFYLPLEKELCPFDLIPTTSTVLQMVVGDLIVCELMTKNNYSVEEYAQNHPAGYIGKKTNLKVKDLMITPPNVPFCAKGDKLVDVLVELSNKRCGCILIVDEKRELQGIFTDGDLRRSLQNNRMEALDLTMEELMGRTPRSINETASAYQAMKKMEENLKSPITTLPVLDEQNCVLGLIKMHDILQSGL